MNYPCKSFESLNSTAEIDAFTGFRKLGDYQALLDSIIVKYELGGNSGLAYYIAPSFTKDHVKDDLGADFRAFFAMLYFLLCATITMVYLLSRLQVEKCARTRDFMRMMGMKDTPYYMSYFIFHAITSFILAWIITILARFIIFTDANIIVIFIQIYLILLNAFFFALLMKYFCSITIALSSVTQEQLNLQEYCFTSSLLFSSYSSMSVLALLQECFCFLLRLKWLLILLFTL